MTDSIVVKEIVIVESSIEAIEIVEVSAQGVQGVKGDKGDTGIQGIQGVKGDKGDTGIQGIQGVKGDTGDQGIQGIQGVKGDKGDTGIQGIQGIQGEQGIQGAAGSDATVNATNVGNAIAMSDVNTSIADTDTLATSKTASSNSLQKISWSGVKSALKTYFDNVYILAMTSEGMVIPENSGIPTNPSIGYMTFFARKLAGKIKPAWIDSNGKAYEVQSALARNRVCRWSQYGSGTTTAIQDGVLITTSGSGSTRAITTTNYFTRCKRLGLITAAAAGAVVTIRSTSAQNTVGDGTGNGGFTLVVKIGVSDAETVAGARMFIGSRASTTNMTNIEPSTLTNCFGVGCGASDSNLKIFYGGSVPQTPIDLGANFPANTLSADMYEIMFYCSAYSTDVNYRVERMGTDYVATGTLTGVTGVALPAASTLLAALWAGRSNNTSALAVALDVAHVYIESEY